MRNRITLSCIWEPYRGRLPEEFFNIIPSLFRAILAQRPTKLHNKTLLEVVIIRCSFRMAQIRRGQRTVIYKVTNGQLVLSGHGVSENTKALMKCRKTAI